MDHSINRGLGVLYYMSTHVGSNRGLGVLYYMKLMRMFGLVLLLVPPPLLPQPHTHTCAHSSHEYTQRGGEEGQMERAGGRRSDGGGRGNDSERWMEMSRGTNA